MRRPILKDATMKEEYIEELEKYCSYLEIEDSKCVERLRWLDALEAAGVDNWEGCDNAVEIFNEGEN